MFIHCASAGRVGGFWIIYRVVHDNWSIEKAEEEARRIWSEIPETIGVRAQLPGAGASLIIRRAPDRECHKVLWECWPIPRARR